MNKKFVYQVGGNKKVILCCTANQISRCQKEFKYKYSTQMWSQYYYMGVKLGKIIQPDDKKIAVIYT